MSTNPFKSKSFKELFREWNKILEDSGHKEIEDFTLPTPMLKEWDRSIFRGLSNDACIEEIRERITYYENREGILKIHEFESENHKTIWTLYSNGLSVRQISVKMNKKNFGKSTIYNYIKHIEKKYGLK